MPKVCRLGDKCTGHEGFPPRPCIEASNNVFANGIGVHRKGDKWAEHRSGSSSHNGVLISGSSTVYVNGKQLGRIGDPISCGSAVAEGSPNVYAGG